MGNLTVLTVTNVDTDENNPHILVEFVYVGRFTGPNSEDDFCLEFNRTEELSPADTFTCLTQDHNPDQDQGYVFVYARDIDDLANGQPPKQHNFLTGNVLTMDGFNQFEYSINPVSFKASGNPQWQGQQGDTLKLDGSSTGYTKVPQQILIPRFLGQGGLRTSELILLGFSGGPQADTTVDFLVWNDNEEVFSSEYTFRCWDRVELTTISALFKNSFLANFTNDDPDEIFDHPSVESGWMHIQGHQWTTNQASFADPAIYAVLIETVSAGEDQTANSMGLADLPFELGENGNGELKAVTLQPPAPR